MKKKSVSFRLKSQEKILKDEVLMDTLVNEGNEVIKHKNSKRSVSFCQNPLDYNSENENYQISNFTTGLDLYSNSKITPKNEQISRSKDPCIKIRVQEENNIGNEQFSKNSELSNDSNSLQDNSPINKRKLKLTSFAPNSPLNTKKKDVNAENTNNDSMNEISPKTPNTPNKTLIDRIEYLKKRIIELEKEKEEILNKQSATILELQQKKLECNKLSEMLKKRSPQKNSNNEELETLKCKIKYYENLIQKEESLQNQWERENEMNELRNSYANMTFQISKLKGRIATLETLLSNTEKEKEEARAKFEKQLEIMKNYIKGKEQKFKEQLNPSSKFDSSTPRNSMISFRASISESSDQDKDRLIQNLELRLQEKESDYQRLMENMETDMKKLRRRSSIHAKKLKDSELLIANQKLQEKVSEMESGGSGRMIKKLENEISVLGAEIFSLKKINARQQEDLEEKERDIKMLETSMGDLRKAEARMTKDIVNTKQKLSDVLNYVLDNFSNGSTRGLLQLISSEKLI